MADNDRVENGVIQRSGLPLLILAAVLFALALGLLFLQGNPLAGGLFPSNAPPPSTAGARSAPEPAAEPSESARPDSEQPALPAEAGPSVRTIVRGDTLFDLAGEYWDDPYLWPVILVANPGTITDPDFLQQGAVVEIPPRPEIGDPASATREVLETVDAAHIEAYRRYRELGNEALARGRETGNPWAVHMGLVRRNKALWVLYSGLRYDPGLLEAGASEVEPEDLSIVRSFVRQFGPRPGGSR